MPRAALLIATLTVALACSEVTVIPPGEGGTSDPGPGAGAAGGSGEQGGSGGVDLCAGPEPSGPVPGCETLQWAGDPVALAARGGFEPHLVALDAGSVGVVFLERDPGSNGPHLRSQVIADAFGAWPPVVGPSVEHLHERAVFDGPTTGLITSRHDGAFSLTGDIRGVASVGAPGMTARFPEYSTILIDPWAGGGAHVTRFDEETSQLVLDHFPLLSPEDLPLQKGSVDAVDCSTVRSAPLSPTDLLLSVAPEAQCGDGASRVDLHRVTPRGIEALGGFDLPFTPHKQQLTARPGGFWYSISLDHAGTAHVYALDADGAPTGEPWVHCEDDPILFAAPDFAPWRDGFAFAVNRQSAGGVRVLASDGGHVTESTVLQGQPLGSNDPIAIVAGGTDQGSILIAYETSIGLTLARADCVTPQ